MAGAGGRLLIELRDVTAAYRGVAVLAHLDLVLGRGGLTGIVGPTGAGKTTLLKVLLGIVPCAAGTVRIDGRAPAQLEPGFVGYVPQHGDLDPHFPITVEQLILMGLAGRPARLPWASRTQRRRVAGLATRLGIGDTLRHRVRDVSGGQRQRALLGRALVCAPSLLVLDEPTSGVDMHTQHDILQLLGELRDSGTTVVLSTHDLNGVAGLLPELVCFNRSVIAQGAPREVFNDQTLSRTFGERLTTLEHDGGVLVVPRQALRL